ncbi:peptidoglycan D,D-transpeptidase FtsI family protein [Thermovenabulum sp.]|uniref:peptidoglycan D,D-transpeptidase FtsI family protein n=1 Tax=Thermovenabulum sp. TaxID=3100335 RepID=UPI003C7A494A
MLVLILVLRLFFIQIVERPYLYEKASSQWMRPELKSIRGGIFSRNGVLLLDTERKKVAFISPGWLKGDEKNLLIEKNIIKADDLKEPFIKITEPQKINILEKLEKISPGIVIYNEIERYGEEALATHLIGLAGKSGIEKKYDAILSQSKKNEEIFFDGIGQPIKGSIRENDKNNWGVYLTIDEKIQKKIEEIMDMEVKKGAVVVMDAKKGEILAMASRPNFKQKFMENFLNDPDSPLLNRAIMPYIPGSVFKLVVLSAALEEKVSDLDEVFNCPGFIKVGGNIFKCTSYKNGGHGQITLRDALAYSCNVAFIELGQRVGKEKIIEYAKKYGLGEKILDEIPEEKPGNIPDPKSIYYQDLGNISIGQGKIQVTPIQVAKMMLTIVNDGQEIKPHVVKKIINKDGEVIFDDGFVDYRGNRVISKENADKIKEALRAACLYGSAVKANLPGENKSAGKTGTAELGDNTTHAWFVGYYPYDEPEYVVSIFLERGGSGPFNAAPLFSKIISEIRNF